MPLIHAAILPSMAHLPACAGHAQQHYTDYGVTARQPIQCMTAYKRLTSARSCRA